jgi:predicted SprT family Zn-dependent metalloprotease
VNPFEAEVLAKQLISEYCPDYSFAWMTRKRVNGYCNYRTKTISLSRPLTELRTYSAVRGTIMHEIAHAITPGSGHGRAWQIQMMKFGLPADRCSQDKIDQAAISNWKVVCKVHGTVGYFIRKPRVRRSCSTCSPRFNSNHLLEYVPCK